MSNISYRRYRFPLKSLNRRVVSLLSLDPAGALAAVGERPAFLLISRD